MKQYIKYTKYLIKHKWNVLLAGMKYFPSLHLFYRLIIHDLSKLSPLEFITYANTFYKPDGSSQYDETMMFKYAWLHHQHVNKHHWQYWQLKLDRGDTEYLPMPDIYIKEMISDWVGAGKAIHNDWYNVLSWYEDKKTYKPPHPYITNKIQQYLDIIRKDKESVEKRIRILGY